MKRIERIKGGYRGKHSIGGRKEGRYTEEASIGP